MRAVILSKCTGTRRPSRLTTYMLLDTRGRSQRQKQVQQASQQPIAGMERASAATAAGTFEGGVPQAVHPAIGCCCGCNSSNKCLFSSVTHAKRTQDACCACCTCPTICGCWDSGSCCSVSFNHPPWLQSQRSADSKTSEAHATSSGHGMHAHACPPPGTKPMSGDSAAAGCGCGLLGYTDPLCAAQFTNTAAWPVAGLVHN